MQENNNNLEIQINDDIFPRLLGVGDENIRYIANHFKSRLTARDGKISAYGPRDEIDQIRRIFCDLEAMCRARSEVSADDIRTIIRLSGASATHKPDSNNSEYDEVKVVETVRGLIRTRNALQEQYVRKIEKMTIVFSIGPAGTGKTYLAVAMAIDRFQRRMVDKIILVRPVVETGETLGFLPGDIQEKVDPYFRPLYDALDEMLSRERVRRFIDKGFIEIAPLAYMRGRTLNNAFVILDEAQNTTSGQMKMFLTRLGVGSNAVLTGDLTQIDLPDPAASGLLEARGLLQGIKGIGFVEFSDRDVVRHQLVADILRAYQGNAMSGETQQ
ncbi:MAG: PhoH family protein [Candidatus Hatepunaea meridiana]|nr:PhoH family protein [Candidatus Hatepunaea meridiana]